MAGYKLTISLTQNHGKGPFERRVSLIDQQADAGGRNSVKRKSSNAACEPYGVTADPFRETAKKTVWAIGTSVP